MAQVSVSIDDKAYRLACDDGQEAHLTELAAGIDQRIKTLRQSFGEIGDMRLMVMTAIMLADEAADLRQAIEAARADAAQAVSAVAREQQAGHDDRRAIVSAISDLARRIEAISAELAPAEE
jgi:cell division protein ZapA